MVVLCLLFAGLFEGVSIASLLPVLSVAQGGTVGKGGGELGRVMGHLLDGISFDTSISILLGVVLLGIALKAVLTWVAMRYVGYSVAEVSTRMRMRIIRQMLEVRWSYLVGQRSGRFTHIINAQVSAAVQAFQAAAIFAASLIQTAILLSVALFVSWQMALTAVGMSVVVALSLRRFVAQARKAGRTQSQRNRELVQFFTEAINNMKPVKAMGRDADFVRMTEKQVRSLRKAARKQVMSKETLKNLEDVVITVLLAVGAFVALVVLKEPLANLLIVALILTRTTKSVGKVQEQYQLVALVESSFDEIQDLLAETAAQKEPQGGTAVVAFRDRLRLEHVTFGYGSRLVCAGSISTFPSAAWSSLPGRRASARRRWST